MDAQGRESASMDEQIQHTAGNVKEKVSDLGRRAGGKLDKQRVRAASALDGTASALHERGDRFASATSHAAHATAEKIHFVADYLRDHDAHAVLEDVEGVIRRHPGPALAAAVIVGFFAGRALRNHN
jgi:ElaB/YqjD/DUF883 family membrane-anchored ribosome-binding protein